MAAARLSRHDRDKIVALLKSVAAECEGDPSDHAWRKCRHCLAVQELDRRDIRKILGEFVRSL